MKEEDQSLVAFARQVTAALDERITAASFWIEPMTGVFVVAVEAHYEGRRIGTKTAAARTGNDLEWNFGAAVADQINKELFEGPGGAS